jgi:hypothetical protein
MMTEEIYNLFVYSDGETISHIGMSSYQARIEDSDEEKCKFLQERSLLDHVDAYKVPLESPRMTLATLNIKRRKGTANDLFEELFKLANVPESYLFAMTIIVNGEARIETILAGSVVQNVKSGEEGIDYMVHYTSERGINFVQMLDDDYLKAIKLLYNSGFIVSCAKLLVIFIDTLAFVEFGDKEGNFKKWLNTFVPLNEINLEANEIWEFRNSLLHMSNLDSREVRRGKVMRLIPAANLGQTVVDTVSKEKQFDLLKLIHVIGVGVSQWLTTYNTTPQKIDQFIERYDTIVSDFRVTRRPL